MLVAPGHVEDEVTKSETVPAEGRKKKEKNKYKVNT